MDTITVDHVLSWSPCREYTRKRLDELWGGREALTVLEILDLPIPADHKLWGVLREEVLPAPLLHEAACQFAEAALMSEREAGREPDSRSWAAITAKRRWIKDEISDEELAAARNAARAAAWTAWDAARVAAWDAAGNTAGAAARKTQIEILRHLLTTGAVRPQRGEEHDQL